MDYLHLQGKGLRTEKASPGDIKRVAQIVKSFRFFFFFLCLVLFCLYCQIGCCCSTGLCISDMFLQHDANLTNLFKFRTENTGGKTSEWENRGGKKIKITSKNTTHCSPWNSFENNFHVMAISALLFVFRFLFGSVFLFTFAIIVNKGIVTSRWNCLFSSEYEFQ